MAGICAITGGSGNHYHNGHLPKQEHEIRKRTSQLDESELEIAEDGLDVNLSFQFHCNDVPK